MTHDEILNMEPGPEMDRAVAEHVMGWWSDGVLWNDQCGDAVGYTVQRWSPSTDIVAAWMVAKHIREKFAYKRQRQRFEDCLYAITPTRGGWVIPLKWLLWEANVPEAICRAALLAVLKGE